ncbi:hypothetical protein IIC65_01570, partial [Candidatus Sumerlaeota bacterium]|nr:hypothetical protein [Candidatus Sumerlaeota bacterium]
FERAARLDPDSPENQYNLGTTLARSARYGEAVAPLIEALASQDVPSRRDAFFNLGYSRVRRAQTEGGVLEDPSVKLQLLRYGLQAFREAIIADSADLDAKHNYEVTEALIRQIEEQMQEEQEEQNSQENQQDGEPESGEQEQDQEQGEGEEGEEQEGEQQDGEDEQDGEDQQGDQEQQQRDQQGDAQQDEESPDDEQGQESGLETTPTPRPTPPQSPSSPQESAGDSSPDSSDSSKPPPLTPEQLDALSVLNTLEQDNPEQFRRLFQFQGRRRSPLERDW